MLKRTNKRAGASASALQGVHELGVFGVKDAAGNAHGLAAGDADAVDKVGLDAGLLKLDIELRASAVQDNGVQANLRQIRSAKSRISSR